VQHVPFGVALAANPAKHRVDQGVWFHLHVPCKVIPCYKDHCAQSGSGTHVYESAPV
jgi:hypothetical protein